MATNAFYEKIVPLNRGQHRKLRIRTADEKARFADSSHYVPLAATEFYQAARDYPILFSGSDEEAGPIALLGLQAGKNLFIKEDGSWEAGAYVPAFVRRYPFILARGDEAAAEFTLCIDENYGGFGESEGDALFDEDGKDTPYLTRMVTFLNSYYADMERTKSFMKRLVELNLLTTRTFRITDSHERNFFLNNFRIVDEEKFSKLDDVTLGELHRNGWLGWIYAHLISLGNVSQLPTRVPENGDAGVGQAD